jgi:hypothetical protein
MSNKVPLLSKTSAYDKTVKPGGVSEEEWKILHEEWQDLAPKLHKLNIFLNFHGHYKPAVEIPESFFTWDEANKAEVHNNKMQLAEIRYGQIEDFASSKPSLWFILKHKKESQAAQINERALCQAKVFIYKNGGILKLSDNIPVNCVKATAIPNGSDTYALLAQHFEQNEWEEVQKIAVDRLRPDEEVIVHLSDSRDLARHICATWSATGEA